ncbi:LysR family transcriptional regulator, partial [Streptococcus agalactiae]|nr:LysR family transcriptional regulator [Streptococcus agalactiae]
QNKKGLLQRLDKLGLEFVELIPFKTHIYLGKDHPLASKTSLIMTDLEGLPTVRFTQDRDDYRYYSENFVEVLDSSVTYNVTDRATLNGILERTQAYATGSGFLDSRSVNGITVIPLEDHLDNQMIYIKRKDRNLSQMALKFVAVMEEYFKG